MTIRDELTPVGRLPRPPPSRFGRCMRAPPLKCHCDKRAPSFGTVAHWFPMIGRPIGSNCHVRIRLLLQPRGKKGASPSDRAVRTSLTPLIKRTLFRPSFFLSLFFANRTSRAGLTEYLHTARQFDPSIHRAKRYG